MTTLTKPVARTIEREGLSFRASVEGVEVREKGRRGWVGPVAWGALRDLAYKIEAERSRQNGRPRRNVARTVLAVALVFGLGACDETPMDPVEPAQPQLEEWHYESTTLYTGDPYLEGTIWILVPEEESYDVAGTYEMSNGLSGEIEGHLRTEGVQGKVLGFTFLRPLFGGQPPIDHTVAWQGDIMEGMWSQGGVGGRFTLTRP